jgi:hypothetical protein
MYFICRVSLILFVRTDRQTHSGLNQPARLVKVEHASVARGWWLAIIWALTAARAPVVYVEK